MIVQVVINQFVGMSMSANDARVLQKITLYKDVWFKEPFDPTSLMTSSLTNYGTKVRFSCHG
jgi:hypothetical protein